MIKEHEKDPDAHFDFPVKWDDWLGGFDGDVITESSFSIAGEDEELEKTNEVLIGGTETRVWLRGGTLNRTYRVTNHIETLGGRENDRSFLVKIVEQ